MPAFIIARVSALAMSSSCVDRGQMSRPLAGDHIGPISVKKPLAQQLWRQAKVGFQIGELAEPILRPAAHQHAVDVEHQDGAVHAYTPAKCAITGTWSLGWGV